MKNSHVLKIKVIDALKSCA